MPFLILLQWKEGMTQANLELIEDFSHCLETDGPPGLFFTPTFIGMTSLRASSKQNLVAQWRLPLENIQFDSFSHCHLSLSQQPPE